MFTDNYNNGSDTNKQFVKRAVVTLKMHIFTITKILQFGERKKYSTIQLIQDLTIQLIQDNNLIKIN